MPDATSAGFAYADVTTFCRLDELGLEVTGQRLDFDRAVLVCRVVEPDRWCRRCGSEGAARDSVTRRLAHEPFHWTDHTAGHDPPLPARWLRARVAARDVAGRGTTGEAVASRVCAGRWRVWSCSTCPRLTRSFRTRRESRSDMLASQSECRPRRISTSRRANRWAVVPTFSEETHVCGSRL